jgi:uncharacterized protein YjbI with pentapeptide repeats
MTTRDSIEISREEPLTRADVELLLLKVGSSENLDLHDRNLQRIDLSRLVLPGAKLYGADLSGADLSGADLSGADLHKADLHSANLYDTDFAKANLRGAKLYGVNFLRKPSTRIINDADALIIRTKHDQPKTNLRFADLRFADLSGADLSGADLSGANLCFADLREVNLSWVDENKKFRPFRTDLFKADLRGVDLRGANLFGTDLRGARLRGADLSNSNLDWTDLRGVDLSKANLHGTTLREAVLSESEEELLHGRGAIGLSEPVHTAKKPTTILHVRLLEEPLMLTHLTIVLSALTELATKCWLIAQERFADLETYTQTHDLRFVEEVPFTIERISYNSPLDATINFSNFDPKNFAQALREGLDTFLLARQRLKQAQLDTETKAAQIKLDEKRASQEYQAKQQELAVATQKADQDQHLAQLALEKQKIELERQHLMLEIDQERQKLELERQRVALQKEILDLENTRLMNAIDAANIILATFAPDAKPAIKAMLVQKLLPNILQFDAIPNIGIVLSETLEEPKKTEPEEPHI